MDACNASNPAHRAERDVRALGANADAARERDALEAVDSACGSSWTALRNTASCGVLDFVRGRIMCTGKNGASSSSRSSISSSSSSNSTNAGGTLQVPRVLAVIVDRAPDLLLKEVATIKEVVEALPRLCPRAASSIMRAMWPQRHGRHPGPRGPRSSTHCTAASPTSPRSAWRYTHRPE